MENFASRSMAKRILLLDDDALIRSMLGDALEARGYEVLPAPTGAQADALLAKGLPDLVIVDGLLPDTRGTEWITKHRERLAARPIFFISAFWKDTATQQRLLTELAVRQVLTKPVDPRLLADLVDAALARPAEPEDGLGALDIEEAPPALSGDPIELTLLRRDAARTLSAKIRELSDALRKVRARPELATLALARVRCQKLGTLSIGCGFAEVAQLAREQELDVRRLKPDPAAKVDWDVLDRRAEAMLARVKQETEPAQQAPERLKQLLVVTDDDATRQHLRAILPRSVCVTVAVGSVEEAVAVTRSERVDAVLVDGGLRGELSAAETAELLRASPGCEGLPLGFISGGDSRALMKAAKELMSRVFIARPMALETVLEAVCTLLSVPMPRASSVAVISDGTSSDEEVGFYLARYGISWFGLELGLEAVEPLQRARPDGVVLLVSGVSQKELALMRAIRARREWEDLPILVVGKGLAAASRLSLLDSGAHDVVAATEDLSEAMTLLRLRIEHRIHHLSLKATDSATGLPSRRSFLEALSRRMADARRRNQSLVVALIRLEWLAGLRAAKGLRAVDDVLATLGQAVEFGIRTEDLRGVWRDDTLVMALLGAGSKDVERVLGRLTSWVAVGGEGFNPKFAISATHFPADGTSMLELLQAAQDRLDQTR